MKIKNLFFAIGLAFAAGSASLAFLPSSISNKPVVEAKAEATPSNTTIYVEVCDAWLEANAVAKLYVTPAGSSWVSATKLKDNLYSFNVPAGVTSFYIYRMNPDHPSD